MRLSWTIQGIDRAQQKLRTLQMQGRGQTRRFVARGTRLMYDKCREFTSLTDHTLADLARLGHPYARRWAPHTLHPDYLVHIQTGTLQAGLTMGVAELHTETVGWVANSTWYDKFVQLGTRYTRPRPYMFQVRVELEPVLREMGRHMFRDLVVSVAGP